MKMPRRGLLTGALLGLAGCAVSTPKPASPETTTGVEPDRDQGGDVGDLATRAPGDVFDPQADLLVNGDRIGAVGTGEFVIWDIESGKISSRVPADVGAQAALWAWGSDRIGLRRPGSTTVVVLDETGVEVEVLDFDAQPSSLALSPDRTFLLAAIPGGARLVRVGMKDSTDLAVAGLETGGRAAVSFIDNERFSIGSGKQQCHPQLWRTTKLVWSTTPEARYWHLRAVESGFVTIEEEGDSFALVHCDADFTPTARHRLGFRPTSMQASATHAVLSDGDSPASARSSAVIVRLSDGATTRTESGPGSVSSVAIVDDAALTLSATSGVAAFDLATGKRVREFEMPT